MRRRRRRHIQIDDGHPSYQLEADRIKNDNEHDLAAYFDERDQQNDDEFSPQDLQIKLAKIGW